MKKLFLFSLIFITSFLFILDVNALSYEQRGFIVPDAWYPDNQKIKTAIIGVGRGGSVYTDLLVNDNSTVLANNPMYLYFRLSNQSNESAEPGMMITSTFYLTMSGNIFTGTFTKSTEAAGGFEFSPMVKQVTIIKTTLTERIKGASHLPFAPVYKIIVKWTPNDILDTVPLGTSVDQWTSWILLGSSVNFNRYASINGLEENTYLYIDADPTQPTGTVEEIEEQSLIQTIISLPSQLLNWFTSLPGQIFSSTVQGFNWIVNGLLDLPENIWDLFSVGFDWVTDGIAGIGVNVASSLYNALGTDMVLSKATFEDMQEKYSGDDMPILQIITSPVSLYNSISYNNTSTLNLPFLGQNLPMPNGQVFYTSAFGSFYNTITSFTYMLTCWFLGLNYLNWIKTFQNPKEDRIEVMDL